MTDSSLLITRTRVTSNATIYIDQGIRERMKLSKGEEVEVRYIEGGNAKMIQITKVEKSK